ncbi:MAG: sigma-70 family RNA polymerase sigma factor [Muribaculaceae bacterium]|nr:sigma-70 family RNA polymerase sigma factor [Muribaculaceae bacterium]
MGSDLLIDTFCKLQQKLHTVAGRLLKDEMEADDAVQDTFCNLWVAELPDTANEARYRLFAVLKNVCLNKLKKKRPVTGTVLPDIAIEPSVDMDADRLKTELLKQLTPLQRNVFILSTYNELEYEEIAEMLNMSIGAVRMQMSRARKVLRTSYNNMKL